MANRMKERDFSAKQRLLTSEDLCAYLGRGKNSARAWADEIGATRKFGKSVRFDRVVIDAALDAMEVK